MWCKIRLTNILFRNICTYLNSFTNIMNYINCMHINIQIIFYSIFIINYGSNELQH